MRITPEMVEYTKQLKASCQKNNQQLADETYLSASSVQRYINGDVSNADRDGYVRLIYAMGGNPDMIFSSSVPVAEDRHERELARVSAMYEARIKSQDRWLNRLAIALVVITTICLLLAFWSFNLDARLPDYGTIQYDASDLTPEN